MYKRPQHKTRRPNLIGLKVGNSLELISPVDNWQLPEQNNKGIGSKVNNKWDLMKLKASVRKTTLYDKKTAYRLERDLHYPTADRGLISKIYKEFKKKLTSKNPNKPNQNIGYRTKQRIENRVIWNGWQALTKMFIIFTHQGNMNQNDSEIPSDNHQNG